MVVEVGSGWWGSTSCSWWAVRSRRVSPGNHAPLVLGAALVSVSIPLPQRRGGDLSEDEAETGNTETAENGQNSQENTVELMTVSDLGWPSVIAKMTPAEAAELRQFQHRAIALLDRCIKHYRETGTTDDGTIPRYDKIQMNAEQRGAIVDALEYSEVASK